MSIAGNLKTMDLAELLQWLSQGKKTGTLVIDSGRVEKRIYFQNGRIISSASTEPEEYLGHFLVSHGFITELELSKAIEMQERTGMLLGKILTTIGAISEPDLHRLLRLKAEESIYDVFSWPEGEFRFLDGELPERTMVPMNLEVTSIVLEGVQRLDEWERIRRRIPSGQAIPVAIGDLLDDPELEPGERKILALVNDDRTVEEIRLQTHSSEFHVYRILARQMDRGRLKIVRPRWGEKGNAAPDTDAAINAEALLKRAGQYLEDKDYDAALRHLNAARNLQPENSQVQRAVQVLEKTIHEELESSGVVSRAIPKLNRKLEELTDTKLSPQEGFILSRINGTYDVESIVKISPMPPLEALVVFWKLKRAGYVRLEGGKSGGAH